MKDSDLVYYLRRLAEEQAQVEQADREDVRAVHATLAEMYRRRISRLT